GHPADELPSHAPGRHVRVHRPGLQPVLGPLCRRLVDGDDPGGHSLPVPAEVDRRRPHRGRGQGMTLPTVGLKGLLHAAPHDGSAEYVLQRPDELGDEAVVRLRLPRATSADRVLLRYERDGEPHSVEAAVDEQTETDVWWRADFPVTNPVVRYRWLLTGRTAGYTCAHCLAP